jgi:cytochrome b pre-mRNA-processing protein 3
MLSRLFRRQSAVADPYPLYAAAIAQSRQPVFYARLGVPDTVDGRFDMVALHVFLILRRLKAEPDAAAFAQALFDMMFADMDRNLREMGVGDLSVGKKVKAMAQGLYGRIAAYEAGMAADEASLQAALRRNLYGTLQAGDAPSAANLAVMAAYLRTSAAGLAGQGLEELQQGRVAFAALPAAAQ